MNGTTYARDSVRKSLSKWDWAAVAVCCLGILSRLVGDAFGGIPGAGLLRWAGVAAGFYLLYRFWSRWRNRLLWSLRNRLILAYLFIAVVPILLLLILASLLAQILYSQLGAYLLYHDFEDRVGMLADLSASLAAAEAALPGSLDEATVERGLTGHQRNGEGGPLPGLKISFSVDPDYFRAVAGEGASSFAGLVQEGTQLHLVGMKVLSSGRAMRLIELNVPVTPDFLDTVAPELGPIDLTLAETVDPDSLHSGVRIGGKDYRAIARVLTRKRLLAPAENWLDPVVGGFSRLDATYLKTDRIVERKHPVFAFFTARRSHLNQRIFASLGELSEAKVFEFQLIAVAFLLIELAALLIGIMLTRAMTGTISSLSRATLAVQGGNFSVRVPVQRRDQLGMLGESFNSMTYSISRLIEEQKQLQRLENEISIAREVQDQLFPRNLPQVEGLEIEAICRAARSVSGDYYDFIPLTPTQVAVVIADISGKGISAALLMASLQAALRSQLQTPGSETQTTAALVGRLNQLMVRNTGDDRFATFFVAIYDTVTRKLRYTNAGHLPALCLSGGKAVHLDAGGMVLGIVENYPYQEGQLEVPPEAVIIGYSDGLVEPENAYGEEFGVSRLEAAAQSVRHATPRKIAESLMAAAEEWSGNPEQADDMTVIVVKLE